MAYVDENYCFEQDGQKYDLFNLPENFVIWGDVWINDRGLSKLPDLSKVIVRGSFICSDNKLTSLEGAPREVRNTFRCDYNRLTSLKGAPKKVGGVFRGQLNPLDSFEGAPVMCTGSRFRCELVMFEFDEYFDTYFKMGDGVDKKKEQAVKANAKKIYETLKTPEQIESYRQSVSLKTMDDPFLFYESCQHAYSYSQYMQIYARAHSENAQANSNIEEKTDKEQNLALILKLRKGMTR